VLVAGGAVGCHTSDAPGLLVWLRRPRSGATVGGDDSIGFNHETLAQGSRTAPVLAHDGRRTAFRLPSLGQLLRWPLPVIVTIEDFLEIGGRPGVPDVASEPMRNPWWRIV
jgi:hypothetical protein